MEKSAARGAQSSPTFSSSSSSSSSAPVPCQKRKAGRKKFRETRHPVYRGVRQRNGNRWVCEVREPKTKSRIWLGTFVTPEMAAAAYDVAALALRGESASLNFPDAAARLPRAKSSSAVDIQVAALEAATALRAPDDASSSCVKKLLETSTSGSESARNAREGSKDIFVDEEALYDMPGLVRSMAEGLLLAPPTMFNSDDDSYSTHFSLWNI